MSPANTRDVTFRFCELYMDIECRCNAVQHHDFSYGTTMTVAEHKSDLQLTKDTPYLALTGELWGVYCDNLEENWPLYNGTVLTYPCRKRNTAYLRSKRESFLFTPGYAFQFPWDSNKGVFSFLQIHLKKQKHHEMAPINMIMSTLGDSFAPT